MRRIADFLDVDIPTALWSEVVERCRFEAMKSQHEASAIPKHAFPEGANRILQPGAGRTGGDLSPERGATSFNTSNSPPSAFPKTPPCGSSMVPSPWCAALTSPRPRAVVMV